MTYRIALFLPLFTTLIAASACTEASTSAGDAELQANTACSVDHTGQCVAPDSNGNTFCDVDHGPSATKPDAAYFLVCTSGQICGIDHARMSFSCCSPSLDCVPGYPQR